MASPILAEIARSELNTIETPPKASITDVKHLSSYNWIEAPTPTIAVPGCPARWEPPAHPRRLQKDSGLVYIAQNAARHPDSPLEPLFRAIYATDPLFDISSTDVVSDRNNIRKLLSFVNPSSSKNGLEPFTIKLEVIGNTVIFCRDETKTQEVIAPHEFRGYGHEFEKAYTKETVTGSTGHHRVISYDFGGLSFIIRHETDGYEGDLAPDYDRLPAILGAMSLCGPNCPPVPAAPESELSIKKDGRVVPLESTIEIKTRVQHKRISVGEVAAQLWVSQTPKLVRAYHDRGMFDDPEVQDMRADISKWEEENQAHLRRLAGLISRILKAVKGGAKGGRAVLKYEPGRGKLVIRKVEEGKMLPKDLYSKWDGGQKCGGDEDSHLG